MNTKLDKIIDRSQSPSYKCNKDFLKKVFGRSDVLPMWVADMDFEVSDPIIQALHSKVDFGIYGYEFKEKSVMTSIENWYKKYHNWDFTSDQIQFVPSVLTGLSIAINQLTNEGDHVIIQPPVYDPFSTIIKSSNRQFVKNPLVMRDGKYVIDFDDLIEKAQDPKAKMILISNPHNPVGRVWTKDELRRLGEIALKNDLIILSDDIHADIVYKNYKYTSIASLSNEIADRTITLLSPGKTFNISGISTAVVVTANEVYKKKIEAFISRYHVGMSNVLSMTAFEAGFAESRAWFEDVMKYVSGNLEFIKEYVKNNIEAIKVVEPEGTYLVWLDMRALGLDPKELQEYLVDEAQLGLNYGHWFGRQGGGFVRMNIATQRENIERALKQLEDAVNKI